MTGATPTSEKSTIPNVEDKERLFDRQASQADTSRPFLQGLAEGRIQDHIVKTFLTVMDKYLRSHHMLNIEFPQDHPVEEVGRYGLGLSNKISILNPDHEV